jgi:uncharacterized protein
MLDDILRTDQELKKVDDYTIFLGHRGSVAHGTFQEKITGDDIDLMGIFIGPPSVTFGIRETETIDRITTETDPATGKEIVWDLVFYSLKKFMRLLIKQNPNVLSMLWLPEKHILRMSDTWADLVRHRSELLSKQCFYSFSGYATGQLKKMIAVGPTGKLGAKRKNLVAEFGYDVKNASHLVRILKMGGEALRTGEFIVERPDRDELLSIKRGEWPLEKVIEYADRLFADIEKAKDESKLQENVSDERVDNLCVRLSTNFWSIHGADGATGKWVKLSDYKLPTEMP